MDLLSTVRKTGSRGGVNFSWEEVATSAHRENYLGHSLKAPVGRWAKGRDLNWYAKADSSAANPGETDQEREARERQEEIRKIKEAEEDAISRALGLPIAPRNVTGANAVEVDGSKIPKRESSVPKDDLKDVKEARPRKEHRKDRERNRDSDRHHRRRHRSRDRHRSRSRSRSRVREGKRPARDTSLEDRDRPHRSRRRSRSPDMPDRHRKERRRDDDQDYDRDYDRRSHRRRTRSRSRDERPKWNERLRSRSRDRSRDRQRYQDRGAER
ncbi:Kinase phosphorylation domain containing protein [Naviculisporaceae sp. PSN 640]